jgi:gliding motility-associated-like protein
LHIKKYFRLIQFVTNFSFVTKIQLYSNNLFPVKRLTKWLFCLIWVGFLPTSSFAQCTIDIAADGCKSEIINFSYTSSGSVTATSWNFGNGNTSSQDKPFYQYNTIGTYTVTLTLSIAGGGTCSATKNITIHDLPIPAWKVASKSKYCLDVNEVTVIDSSSSGISGGNIQSQLILWGDGGRTLTNNPNIKKEESYTYGKPGTFDIIIEHTNNKGCKIKSSNQITILPVYIPSFELKYTVVRCDTLEVCFKNDSIANPSILKSLQWKWGDGQDSTIAFTDFICHAFTNSSTFITELCATHVSGCVSKASIVHNVVLPNLTLTPDLGKKKQCIGNEFIFIHPQYQNVNYSWEVTNKEEDFKDERFNSVYSGILTTPGKYYVKLMAQSGFCRKFYFDSVEVVGVKAKLRLLNDNQCKNLDTVFFNAYLSTYGTKNYELMWNFRDSLAPKCTTSTSGNNYGCDYSLQTFGRHKYKADGCYFPTFYIKDLDNGCTWDDRLQVTIRELKEEDITYEIKKNCVGSDPDFKVRIFVPDCIKYRSINYDSACNEDLFVAYSEEHNYLSLCDTGNWVTVGFDLINGEPEVYSSNDTSSMVLDYSRVCRLFFWKHHWFKLNPVPLPEFLTLADSCPPSSTRLFPYAQLQPNVVKAAIDWGDYSYDTLHFLKPTDSLRQFPHIFSKSGIFKMKLTLFTDSGCYARWGETLELGHAARVWYDPITCPGKEIVLFDTIQYFFNDTLYWLSKARKDAGLEAIVWDLDDGKGFSYKDNNATAKFALPGKYTVRMASKDRNNCWDTLLIPISVTGIKANIKSSDKKVVCDDIIQFFDSSDLNRYAGLDSIAEYYWDFGDGTTPSYLKNPFHYFTTNDTFTITHAISTVSGCSDTMRTKFYIGGPLPKFSIKDTVGCAPFTAQFINEGKAVSKYIWYYGDPGSSTYSTSKDTQVSFTYNQPGVYDVYLFGSDSVANPDNQNQVYYCSAWFPDSAKANPPKRRIYVLPNPNVDFALDEIGCLKDLLNLKSTADSIYTRFNWSVGNNNFTSFSSDTSIRLNDTGTYVISFFPTYDGGSEFDIKCFDTAFKSITIKDVTANFSKQKGDKCNDFIFTNLTTNAAEIDWTFSVDNKELGKSKAINPKFDFGIEKNYADICLKVKDSFGCVDVYCDTLQLAQNAFKLILPNVFTPGDDDKNDVFDIDIENYGYYKLTIFNRWGEIVYQSLEDGKGKDEINWNGGYMNSLNKLPNGAYFYVLETKELCDPNAEIQKITGTVTLLREPE